MRLWQFARVAASAIREMVEAGVQPVMEALETNRFAISTYKCRSTTCETQKNSNSVENEPIELARVWLERQIASHKLWERNEEAVLVIRHWNRYRIGECVSDGASRCFVIDNIELCYSFERISIWSEDIFVHNNSSILRLGYLKRKIEIITKDYPDGSYKFCNQCLPSLSLRWYSDVIISF